MGLFSRSESATHFPPVEGRRLDGIDVSFPDDLPAAATLLVVLFRDDLDPLADQWARLGDRLAEDHGDRVAVVEAPVVNKKLKFLGSLATTGIRGQVDDEAERERTVPLYVDVKAFRKDLGLKSTGDVYAFLLARDGRIAWRGEGGIDLDEVEALEAAVRDLLADEAAPDSPLDNETDESEASSETEAADGADPTAEVEEPDEADPDDTPPGDASGPGEPDGEARPAEAPAPDGEPTSAAFQDDPPPVAGA